jgi:uncharacterized membrane protein
VNRAKLGQPVKSIVKGASVDAPGGSVPSATGYAAGGTTTGLHAAPAVWVKVNARISTFSAVPGPSFVSEISHTRAFCVPVLLTSVPESDAERAVSTRSNEALEFGITAWAIAPGTKSKRAKISSVVGSSHEEREVMCMCESLKLQLLNGFQNVVRSSWSVDKGIDSLGMHANDHLPYRDFNQLSACEENCFAIFCTSFLVGHQFGALPCNAPQVGFRLPLTRVPDVATPLSSRTSSSRMESKAKFLGHPLHQMLIVFPLGLLATASIFDGLAAATGNRRWYDASYRMMAAGVLSGVVTAVPGAIDYLAIPSNTRAHRIGLIHGLGNVAITGMFAASWMARRFRPSRPTRAAVAVSTSATLLALITAWLGGELVDRLGIGVDDHAHPDAPNSLSHEQVGPKRIPA